MPASQDVDRGSMMSDEIFEDDGCITTLAEEQATSYDGPCCEKCAAPLTGHEAIACRQCGWYASIGSFAEIDQSWEVATDPELGSTTGSGAENTEVPQWAWIVMGCVAGVIIESVAARLLTPADSEARTFWALTQLFAGASSFAVCHGIAFSLLMKSSTDTNLTNIFLHPLLTWAQLIRELPRRQWVCYVGWSGLVAAVMSVVVIGGLPYERLLDWGVKPPPKMNLMGAIMSQAQGDGEDDKSLEEAVADLAGTQNLDEDGKKKKKAAPQPRQKDDCVVLGYQTTSDGLIYSLLLGGEHYGKLVYAGKISLNLPLEENRLLAQELAGLKTRQPFVKVPVDQAHWVTPRYVLRVNYKRKGKQGGLYNAELEDLVGMVEMTQP